jgi:hypothetical protein
MRIKQARSSQLYFIEVVDKMLNLPPRIACLHHDRGKIAAASRHSGARSSRGPGIQRHLAAGFRVRVLRAHPAMTKLAQIKVRAFRAVIGPGMNQA